MSDPRTRLFLVTPPLGAPSDIPHLDSALRAGDVACLLLRLRAMGERSATDLVKAIAPLVQDAGIALLVEDARMATRAGADGVHIDGAGQELADALQSLKPERIVGAGGFASRDDAMRAGETGVDYLMFGDPDGDVDPADTLERVAWWAEIFNVPCVGHARALDHVAALAKAGADFVALGEAVWGDPRGAAAAVAEAQAALAAASLPLTERTPA